MGGVRMDKFFPTFLGNDNLRARLAHAIKGQKLPHAMLLEGCSGCGKKKLATLIAAALECEGDLSSIPCGECHRCRKILSGLSIDVTVIGKEDRATIGIDKIRALREDMHLTATESKNKIYIIDDAEALTQEAQNALLVSIEEPPPHVYVFLLCTNTDTILPTIKSRVQNVKLQKLSLGQLSEYLLSTSDVAKRLSESDKKNFNAILLASNGTIGQALHLLEPKNTESLMKERSVTDAIVEALTKKTSFSVLYERMYALPQKRQELSVSLASISLALRDLILLKQNEEAMLLYHTDETKAKETADNLGTRYLLALYDCIASAEEECAQNTNISSLLSALTNDLYACRSK